MRRLYTNTLNVVTHSMISIATVTLSLMAAPMVEAQSADGQIRVEYETAQTPLYQLISEILQRDQGFEAEAEILSQLFVLPRDITLSFQECRTGLTYTAYYDPSESLIVLCYELLESFRRDFAAEEATAEEAPTLAINAGKFVFLHELGHALIHDWEIPVLGREEDAADQFATVLLSFGKEDRLRLAWAAAVQLLLFSEQHPDQHLASDEHSSPLQRFHSIACLGYGSSPEEYSDIPEDILPTEQRDQCVEEFQRTTRSWIQLLRSYIRPKPE